jgi:hypothetical protein
MPLLSSQDRERLSKILGMLGSKYDGERASAAMMATNVIKQRGLTWGLILQVERDFQSNRRRQGAHEPPPKGWVADAKRCQAASERMTEWEREFIVSILSKAQQWPNLTEKQASVLHGIVAKLFGGTDESNLSK